MVSFSKLAKVFVFVSPEYEFITKKTKESERKLRRELIETIDSLVSHMTKLKQRVKALEKQTTDNQSVTTHYSELQNIKDDVSSVQF